MKPLEDIWWLGLWMLVQFAIVHCVVIKIMIDIRAQHKKAIAKKYDAHMRANFPIEVAQVEFELFLKDGTVPSHFCGSFARSPAAQA